VERPGIESFRLLCEAVEAIQQTRIQLLVLDADGYDFDAFKRVFGELPQGKGEAYWIKSGEIAFRDHGYGKNRSSQLLANRLKAMQSS